MRDRTVDRVESWDARPYSGGFATLRDMSDANFSGVVVSGDAWLFMLNGRIVGIVDGDVEDFEDGSGTMYEAPDPALPLLFSMQERGGTTQAKYYTNDTPLDEADRTLSDANFTGYVELSENVLSGDYYLVYYGGRALPVAFVGTTNELKTGDEAYDLATDEVGVYEVIKTPVNVTQVPGPRSDEADSEAAAGAAGAGAGAAAAESGSDAAEADSGDDVQTPGDSQARAEAGEAAQPDPEPAETPEPSAEAAAAEEYAADASDSVVEAAEPDEPAQAGSSEAKPAESAASSAQESTEAAPSSSDGPAAEAAGTEDSESSGSGRGEQGEAPADDSSVFSEEEQWRQTKSIPSLSPSEREKRRHQQAGEVASADQQAKRPRSEQPQGATDSEEGAATETGAEARQSSAPSQTTQQTQPEQTQPEQTKPEQTDAGAVGTSESESSGSEAGGDSAAPNATTTAGESGPDAEASAAAEERIAELESRLEQLDVERNDLEDDLTSVRSERDDLRTRVRQLEKALEEAGGESTSGPTLTPDEALAGTNLFVRYGSRGAPTLDDLTGKAPDAEAINKNLRIDHHTQFESTEAAVDGTPFEQFLERTSAYRFVSWLVRELPYEVLDAGHRSDLGDLYDVIPDIDRAELQGVVEVDVEEGAERREFDIVLRDRMGNPLVVAELNDERDPVSGGEMESLIESAQVVGEGAEDIGAAFYVTASFFEPDALENAAEATETGGILSRSDRASYVKLARKRGFHLCLAEDRNDTFHLTVPEL